MFKKCPSQRRSFSKDFFKNENSKLGPFSAVLFRVKIMIKYVICVMALKNAE